VARVRAVERKRGCWSLCRREAALLMRTAEFVEPRRAEEDEEKAGAQVGASHASQDGSERDIDPRKAQQRGNWFLLSAKT
jgi:hypothetical protein